MFSLYYKKNDNSLLFSQLENEGFSQLQNYIPIYSEFFELSTTNYSLINLNNKYTISSINNSMGLNVFSISTKMDDNENNIVEKDSFFKFSPLLNPLKYLTGKYKHITNETTLTPTFNKETYRKNHLKKLHDRNNTSYVDGFFSYLSSKLLNDHDFMFGNDFYGTFIGIQNDFNMNVFDDLDYLHQSEFFHKNKGEMFKIDNFDLSLLDDDTRKYREKITMEDQIENVVLDEFDNKSFNEVFELTEENVNKFNSIQEIEISGSLIYENIQNKNRTASEDLSNNTETSSNISDSDNSETSDDEEDEDEVSGEDSGEDVSAANSSGIETGELVSCSNSEISEYSSSMEENINCIIHNFPVQIICMEKMHQTLDDYIENNEMTNEEWTSCFIQIIFILITYQKCFDFTHNDLHTNNIMYIKTPKKYIYVKYNNQHYKIPTFGKIYKIIDFGRAIYKYKGKQLCCDSYNFKEDASNQYNFEPYKNHNKPEILPNNSFDLCRLGCSLYDYFIDDYREEDLHENEIVKLIIKWTRDDKNRNILYKKNGEERYPDFKLYKMIARTVHNCIPCDEIKNKLFQSYVISKKKINKKAKIINIDDIPIYR